MNFAESFEMELYSAKRCAVYFADRCRLLEQRMERLEQLERLCIDIYNDKVDEEAIDFCPVGKDFHDRMYALGLLDGEQND